MQPRIVVDTETREQRWRRYLLSAAGVAGLFGGLYGLGIHHGREQGAEFLLGGPGDQLGQCMAELEVGDAQRQRLAEQVAFLGQSVEIERQACAAVSGDLSAQQQQILKLREQVAFYRGIVAPDEAAAGMRIHSFEVQAAADQNYEYRLTVTQSVRGGEVTSARVKISLDGLREQKPVEIPFGEIALGGAIGERFEFRYYKEFFGQFRLPEKLKPLRFTVVLDPVGRGKKTITRTFTWTELLS